MPLVVTFLWCSLILLQAAAAFRIWRSGLIPKFPALFSWFASSAVFSVVLFLLHHPHESPAYPATYSVACMLTILLETGCIVECFFALSVKFRNFAKPGGIVLILLWIIAVIASTAARLAWVPADWTTTWQLTMLGARYADLAMTIVLLGAWLLLRVPRLPIPSSANRAALIVLGHSLYGFLISSLNIATGNRLSFWRAVLPLAGGCVTALCAAALLTRESDVCADVVVPSRMEVLEKVEAAEIAEARYWAIAKLLRRLEQ